MNCLFGNLWWMEDSISNFTHRNWSEISWCTPSCTVTSPGPSTLDQLFPPTLWWARKKTRLSLPAQQILSLGTPPRKPLMGMNLSWGMTAQNLHHPSWPAGRKREKENENFVQKELHEKLWDENKENLIRTVKKISCAAKKNSQERSTQFESF